MIRRSVVPTVLAVLALAACGTPAPSPPTANATQSPVAQSPADATQSPVAASPAPSGAAPRPVVITTDMGMDDLLAVYILLRDPAVDVRAITVDGTGLVHCGPGLRNLRRILVAFGRPEIPFACGRDDAGDDGTPFPDDWRAGSDDMYGIVLPPVVGTSFPPDGAALLADEIEAAPAPVTIVALGPWTTLQDLFAASPGTLDKVSGIHAMAGAIDVPGNMELDTIRPSDGVEWNVGADPDSVADVLALDVPVAFVPLDATNDVPVPTGVFEQLEADHAAAGADIAYETYARAPFLAGDGTFWWDATAAVALSDPTLLSWEDAGVSISERGRISRDGVGRTVRFATGADTVRVQAAILEGLQRGAPRPEPFITTGTVRVTWDGATCRLDSATPTKAGTARVDLVNTSDAQASLLVAGVRPPKTWADVIAFVDAADVSDPDFTIPEWLIIPPEGGPDAQPGATGTVLIGLEAPLVGFVCVTGRWPDLAFAATGTIPLEE